MRTIIYIKGMKYYYNDSFWDRLKAVNVGRLWRRRNKSRWFIIKRDDFLSGQPIFDLYLTKVRRIF